MAHYHLDIPHYVIQLTHIIIGLLLVYIGKRALSKKPINQYLSKSMVALGAGAIIYHGYLFYIRRQEKKLAEAAEFIERAEAYLKNLAQ